MLLATKWGMERRWSEALDAFEQAMATAPSFDTDIATNFAYALANVGRANDAMRVLEAARTLDPLGAYLSVVLQMVYYLVGREEELRREYERTKSLAREEAEHTQLFRVWAEGDLEATKTQFRRFLKAQIIVTPYMAEYLEVIENPGAVSAILRQAFDDPENQDPSRMALLACHMALNGETELAVAAARRGVLELGFPAPFLYWCPIFKEARQTSGFKQFIRDLGVYDYWRESGNWGDYARPMGEDDFEIVA